jgi:hypothetical protein
VCFVCDGGDRKYVRTTPLPTYFRSAYRTYILSTIGCYYDSSRHWQRLSVVVMALRSDNIPGTDPSATALYIGDKVRIEGLVTAKQYNGFQGLVVGGVDNIETNRCDVRIRHDGIGRVLSIHKQNLFLVHREKSFRKYDEVSVPGLTALAHLSVVGISGAKCRIAALVEQNLILLREFELVAMDEMTNSIIAKWREQQFFVRFVDGDTRNCRRAGKNLQVVSLKHAMENINDWAVDWDLTLTHEETRLVKFPTWHRQLLAAVKRVENERTVTQSAIQYATDIKRRPAPSSRSGNRAQLHSFDS